MKIVLMYGGKSCEHDISVITAKQAAAAIKGDVSEVYVSRDGEWLLAENMPNPKDFADRDKIAKLKKVVFAAGDNTLYLRKGKKLKPLFKADAAVLCFHGVQGEDGCVQGLMELCGIPYTSCGVAASAVGMDKIIGKSFLKGLGAPVLESRAFDKSAFDESPDAVLYEVAEALGFPVIVKPANLGSSIGISVCRDIDGLAKALTVGFGFDNRVLVERALTDFCDVNVSVMKKDGKILLSEMEKPIGWTEFLSFDDKYMSGVKGMADTKRQFPFDCRQGKDIGETAKKIYRELDCKGVVRIDFLIDNADGSFYVNELNTIPGSMAFYLWEKQFDFGKLMDIQLDGAKQAFEAKQNLLHLYNSDVLKNKSFGKK